MKKSSLSKKLTSAPYLVWAAIFIIVPLIFVLYYSVTDANGNFSLQYIVDIGKYKDIMLNSIWLGFIATVISLVMAYPLAYIMARSKANVQRTMMMLVMLPMWMNLLIRTYSMMILMQDTGIINTALEAIGLSPVHMINTQGAVVLGMVYNYIPYMILPLYSIMAKLDYSLVEAAQDLGANKLTVIKNVVIPHSLPGIASGFTMVFVPSVSTFYISKKLGGNTFSLIGDIIEMQFKSANNYNLGAALSMVLMVLIIICMMVMNQFTGDDDDGGVLI
ncbi:MAG: ABC transporter permease [Clostridia bacterium]|jgi:spermidine/putrescine transport system permease protein|nr:ABC transporter permease [Clostridia bacterium]MBQ5905406.1 ABC transporter permease [Clostridia bacterium]